MEGSALYHFIILSFQRISDSMNLEKLFGSKAKVDIIKYLLFRRQGVSMRALESELERTFPAIKKQVDSLLEAQVIDINKEGQGWSITIKPEFHSNIQNIFFYGLRGELITLFLTYGVMIDKHFFGKRFGTDIEPDLVIIYKNCEKPQIDTLKEQINDIFRSYFIETVSVVFMSLDEWQKRYRLADRFVLQIMRHIKE